MPAQEKLSPTEQLLAYVIGGGVTLAVLALFLFGLNVIDRDYTLSFLLIGLVLIVIGVAAWLYLLKPWEKFDDLKTPHYTGHAEPHEAHAAPAAEPVAEPAHSVHEAERAAEPVAEVVAEMSPEDERVAEPVAEAVAEAVSEPAAELEVPTAAAEEEPESAPEPVAPAATGPDDLTIVEGIGPKSAQALIASGITSFAQIAEMTPEDLVGLIKAKNVRLVGSADSWPEQARLAAAGDLDGLQALKDSLRGGRA